MFRNLITLLFLFGSVASAHAQWEIQESHTTASLRGIHAVSSSVAWASGTQGTILRTLDGGLHWQKCATPPDAENLDFRGVWAWGADWGLGDVGGAWRTFATLRNQGRGRALD